MGGFRRVFRTWTWRERQRTAAHLFHHGPMLLIDSFLQRLLALPVERKQIGILARPPVQNSSAAIDGSVNQRVQGAAVLGLNVVHRSGYCEIRVVSKKHALICPRWPS